MATLPQTNLELERTKHRYISALRAYRAVVPGMDTAASKEEKFFLERLRNLLRQFGLSSQQIDQLGDPSGQPLEAAAVPPPFTSLKHATTAMLVIHGIGQQDPYETLDQFARNLTRYLRFEGGIEDLTVSAQKIDHNGWVEAMIRLRTGTHGPQTQEGDSSAHIDLYEYYWAPETQDKITYKQSLEWLIKTTLTPIRMLDQNVKVIESEPDSENMTRSAILSRELRRIALLYIPLAALLALLVVWIPTALNMLQTLKNIAQEWSLHPWARGGMTLLFAVSAVFYWVAFKQGMGKLVRWRRQQTDIVSTSVAKNTFLLGVALTIASLLIGYFSKVNVQQYFHPFLNFKVLGVFAAAGLARILQLVLQDFVGDVAVYVNADAKAKNFAVRQAILAGATQAITRLLREQDRGYDQIIVAGHSLGSVIAYDSLNQLMNRCEAPSSGAGNAVYATEDQIVGSVPLKAAIHRADLAKIKGLVTFGSPLDKVHYFFREDVPDNQSIRAQILAFLHSFRKRGSGSDYGICRFEKYSADQLGHLLWLNAWSKEDPVSGMLHFYTNVVRKEFNYPVPIYAHLSYWEDLRFYAFFAEPMLFATASAQPLKVMRATV